MSRFERWLELGLLLLWAWVALEMYDVLRRQRELADLQISWAQTELADKSDPTSDEQ